MRAGDPAAIETFKEHAPGAIDPAGPRLAAAQCVLARTLPGVELDAARTGRTGACASTFDPGTRYAYSGEGFILLQFVLERGLGFDVGREMQHRVFDRFGMANTSMMWRADFADNLADGWDEHGRVEAHDERSKVRAAGSMDTTIADMARLAAGYVRGEGLSARARTELTRPQLAITTAGQFPSLQPESPPPSRRKDLAAGLGVIVFEGRQGPGFFKGGHNDITGNTWVCLKRSRTCVVILANDVRAEPGFPKLVEFLLGDTGVPWSWEYGQMRFVQ